MHANKSHTIYTLLCVCCVSDSRSSSLVDVFLMLRLIFVEVVCRVVYQKFTHLQKWTAVTRRKMFWQVKTSLFFHLNYLVKANYILHYVIDKLCWLAIIVGCTVHIVPFTHSCIPLIWIVQSLLFPLIHSISSEKSQVENLMAFKFMIFWVNWMLLRTSNIRKFW